MQGRLRVSLVSFIFSSVISTGYAATNDQTSQHPSSWHVGVINGMSIIDTHEPGASDNNISDAPSTDLYSFKNRSYTAGFYFGYDWAVTPRSNLGWEAGYQDLGQSALLFNYDPTSLIQEKITDKVRAYNLLLTSKYWLTNHLDLFSKIGVAYEQLTRQNMCSSGNCNTVLPVGGTKETRYYLNPEFQLGVGWQFADHWNLNVAYQRIFGDSSNTTKNYNIEANPYYPYDTHFNPTISSILLGVDYQFSTVPAVVNTSKLHPAGWYVGVFNGMDVINTRETGASDDSGYSAKNVSYTLRNRNYTGGFYAGYDWALTNRWSLGVEGGYQNLGHTNWTENDISGSYYLTASDKISALNALLTAKYWINNQFDLFTKLGVAYEQLSRTVSCAESGCVNTFLPLKNSPTQHNYYLAPELQLGLGWQIANHWNVNLAYQQIFGDGMSTEDGYVENQNSATNPTIQSILLGVDYHFADIPGIATSKINHPGGWHLGAVNGLSVINTHELQETNIPDGYNSVAYTAGSRSYTAGIYAAYDWALNNDWNIGVEVGYQDFGNVNSTITGIDPNFQINNTDKIKAVDLLLTAKYWLTNRVDLFGKLGAAYEWLRRDAVCQQGGSCNGNLLSSGVSSETRYSINPEMQIGLGWQFLNHWNANIAYQHLFTNTAEQYDNHAYSTSSITWFDWHTNPSIDTILLGVDYQFSDVPTLTTMVKEHPGGWHVGTTAGTSVINSNESGPSENGSGYSFDYTNRSPTAGIYAGYDWSLTNSWLVGAEMGYASLGSTNWNEVEIGQPYSVQANTDIHAIDFLLTTKYWMSNQIDIFGKLGVAYKRVHTRMTCEVTGDCEGYLPESGYAEEDRYDLNPEFQLGLGWEIAENWNLSIAYRKVMSSLVRVFNNLDAANLEVNPDINSFLLGVDYQFDPMHMSSTVSKNHAAGWHTGITNGFSVIETDESSASQSEDGYTYQLNNQSYSAGIYVGYDWLLTNRWALGVEAGYQDLGRSKWKYDNTLNPAPAYVSAVTTIKAPDTLLTTKYWLSNHVDIFGKLGIVYELLNRKVSCSGTGCGNTGDDNYVLPGTTSENRYYLNPELQAGLGWQVADNWNIDFAYQQIYSSTATSNNSAMGGFDRHNNPSISSLLVGIDYQF